MAVMAPTMMMNGGSDSTGCERANRRRERSGKDRRARVKPRTGARGRASRRGDGARGR